MSDTAHDLAGVIDAAVAAVPGVEDTYSARPAVARIADRLAETPTAHAHVEDTRNCRRVTVCIGVRSDRDSADVGAAVAGAVRDALGSTDGPVEVRVRVSRLIRPSSPSSDTPREL